MSGGGGNDSRWLVSYADMVTLLMAFFVALYGISHSDQKKFHDFLKGLGAFGNPAAANAGILKGGPAIVGGGVSLPQAQAVTATAATGATPGTAVSPLVHPGVVATPSTVQAVAAQIEAALNAQGLGGDVSFSYTARGLVATIATDHVLFNTGSSQVSAPGQRIIAAIAPTLARLNNPVLIEGYTDNTPLNSNGYTNWNLSTDRAVAVLQILQGTYNIDPNRLSAAGYGEYHPVASNATPQGRSANRRVQIVILTDPAITP